MNKVFDGNIPATQRMLRVILKNDKIKVRKVSVICTPNTGHPVLGVF